MFVSVARVLYGNLNTHYSLLVAPFRDVRELPAVISKAASWRRCTSL